MSNKILIISIFISNIAFGAVIVVVPNTSKALNVNKTNKISSKSMTQLYNRGLEEKAAKEKILKSIAYDAEMNDTMAQNILNAIELLKEEDIVSYVSKTALLDKKIDLSSYDTIVALIQNTRNLSVDKEMLLKIEKIALVNGTLKKMKATS